jgi:hypothetical protein
MVFELFTVKLLYTEPPLFWLLSAMLGLLYDTTHNQYGFSSAELALETTGTYAAQYCHSAL